MRRTSRYKMHSERIRITYSSLQLLSNEVVVGGAFTLGQLQNGAVLPTLAAQNITVSADFPPSDPDRAVRHVSHPRSCTGMVAVKLDTSSVVNRWTTHRSAEHSPQCAHATMALVFLVSGVAAGSCLDNRTHEVQSYIQVTFSSQLAGSPPANVAQADLLACNAVIQVVDRLLLPVPITSTISTCQPSVHLCSCLDHLNSSQARSTMPVCV